MSSVPFGVGSVDDPPLSLLNTNPALRLQCLSAWGLLMTLKAKGYSHAAAAGLQCLSAWGLLMTKAEREAKAKQKGLQCLSAWGLLMTGIEMLTPHPMLARLQCLSAWGLLMTTMSAAAATVVELVFSAFRRGVC